MLRKNLIMTCDNVKPLSCLRHEPRISYYLLPKVAKLALYGFPRMQNVIEVVEKLLWLGSTGSKHKASVFILSLKWIHLPSKIFEILCKSFGGTFKLATPTGKGLVGCSGKSAAEGVVWNIWRVRGVVRQLLTLRRPAQGVGHACAVLPASTARGLG